MAVLRFGAATAGTGGEIVSQNATGSICPKGWKLPSSGDNITKGTFGYMLSQYGVQSKIEAESSVSGSDGTLNTYNIALSPLFLVRAGYVNLYYPSEPFRDAGRYGYYWSSRASSSTSNAYRLSFYTSVSPSSSSYRYLGQSLRCLIPTP